jgi:hypothetical protein
MGFAAATLVLAALEMMRVEEPDRSAAPAPAE